MSGTLNSETKDCLTREIKRVQEKCSDTYNIIKNIPNDTNITQNNIGERALCYIEGLRSDIQNSTTQIVNDKNFILSQFLAESKERLTHVEELTAFTRGTILDIDNEIQRLDNLTKMGQKALVRSNVKHEEIKPEHIHKAKQTFQMLKSELHSLIQSLFPNESDSIMEVMGQLLQEKLNEESNGYILKTQENYWIIELLKDMNIVTLNPYNNMEVKIAY